MGHMSSDVCEFCPLDLGWLLHVQLLCCREFMFFMISYCTVTLVLNCLLVLGFYFIFSPHSKDFSLVLSYSFVLCKDTSVRSVELLASSRCFGIQRY